MKGINNVNQTSEWFNDIRSSVIENMREEIIKEVTAEVIKEVSSSIIKDIRSNDVAEDSNAGEKAIKCVVSVVNTTYNAMQYTCNTILSVCHFIKETAISCRKFLSDFTSKDTKYNKMVKDFGREINNTIEVAAEFSISAIDSAAETYDSAIDSAAEFSISAIDTAVEVLNSTEYEYSLYDNLVEDVLTDF